ncbi:DNA (cytosine-5)-methyltransferase 3A-like [Uloborus diversus]|uniref:DNA (cytosine-5)-methyltransferase 3A-like n=1 Tax=Uloborus diversus TaxID=327109 RepID=UPI002409A9D6|nr:DNA (cytosine-5)-methyltransferase 3A-like [Uloborus diversus]
MFQRGELVWGKLNSYPWWPSIVIDANDCGCDATENKQWLFWLGDHKISEVDCERVVEFKKCFHKNFLPNSGKYMKRAIQEALKILADHFEITVSDEPSLLKWAKSGFKTSVKCVKEYEIPTFAKEALQTFKLKNLKRKIIDDDDDSDTDCDSVIVDVRNGLKKLEDVCISCCKSGSKIIRSHPLFVGGLCQQCKKAVYKICKKPCGQARKRELDQSLANNIHRNPKSQELRSIPHQFALRAPTPPNKAYKVYTDSKTGAMPLVSDWAVMASRCPWQLALGPVKLDFCIVCGIGGSLVYCSSNICLRAYCKVCIDYMASKDAYDKILKNDSWLCYVCETDDSSYCLIKRKETNLEVPASPPLPEDKHAIRVISHNYIGLNVLKKAKIKVSKYCVDPSEGDLPSNAKYCKNYMDFSDVELKEISADLVIGAYFVPSNLKGDRRECISSFFVTFFRFMFRLDTSKLIKPYVRFVFVAEADVIDENVLSHVLRYVLVDSVTIKFDEKKYFIWSNIIGVGKMKGRVVNQGFKDSNSIEEEVLSRVIKPLKRHFESEANEST